MTRLTPQHAFGISVTASMLRQFYNNPNTKIEGGFTLKRVLKDAGEWLNLDVNGDYGPRLLTIAARLDELEKEALAATPMTSGEVLSFSRANASPRSHRMRTRR